MISLGLLKNESSAFRKFVQKFVQTVHLLIRVRRQLFDLVRRLLKQIGDAVWLPTVGDRVADAGSGPRALNEVVTLDDMAALQGVAKAAARQLQFALPEPLRPSL